jgi:hypothetical protein
MARPLRFQYPGAVYHVMARGDGGKKVFETDDDRWVFSEAAGRDLRELRLAGTCLGAHGHGCTWGILAQ